MRPLLGKDEDPLDREHRFYLGRMAGNVISRLAGETTATGAKSDASRCFYSDSIV
jgi:hypothetical protein